MSALARLSRSKSKSPQHSPSSSPKRKPLHERSHSETNSIAGSASTGPAPVKDDSDPVYTSSPFPRLPSQVLSPKDGCPFIFEDSTATGVTNENAGSPSVPSRASSRRKPKSPPGSLKGRCSPRHSPRASLEAARSKPGSVVARYGRIGPRDTTKPLEDARRAPKARTNSRVRSIVSAIESSSVKSQSPPPTPPSLRTRSRGSRASVSSRRFEIGSRDAESIPEFPLHLSSPSSPVQSGNPRQQTRPRSPVNLPTEGAARRAEAGSPQRSPRHQPSEHRVVSEDVRPTTSASSRHEGRPRSRSAPGSSAETFLAALIASGAIEYPTLERPSVTTLRTDSSSLRHAVPQPLQLRRQPALSNLALAQASDAAAARTSLAQEPRTPLFEDPSDDHRLSVISFDAPSTRPSTPSQQVIVRPPSTARWTPGRWDSEMEDDVPELRPQLLRQQRSYRDSSSDLRKSESVTSLQSTTSNSPSFYHFLNDSKTAWARAYYRGEGAIRLMTPPSVTMIRTMSARSMRSTRPGTPALNTPPSGARAMTPPSRHSRSVSDSDLDHTPDSASYAQEVFIPRIRPFQNQIPQPQRRLPPIPVRQTDEGEYTDYGVDDHVPTPVVAQSSEKDEPAQPHVRHSFRPHRESAEGRRYYGIDPPLPGRPQSIGAFYPTSPLPTLSPDRGNDDRISIWRPPSIERENIFGIVNRQVFLFCLGFCFPFAWMLAAFLPLPSKPPILCNDPEIHPRPESVADLNELFNQQDVRRYQKARWWRVLNRAMSVVGTFVIAAIIALAIIGTR